jgi:hypothetical protein
METTMLVSSLFRKYTVPLLSQGVASGVDLHPEKTARITVTINAENRKNFFIAGILLTQKYMDKLNKQNNFFDLACPQIKLIQYVTCIPCMGCRFRIRGKTGYPPEISFLFLISYHKETTNGFRISAREFRRYPQSEKKIPGVNL